MDLNKILQQLYADKARIERVIAELEKFQPAEPASTQTERRFPKRRGRKSMGAAERQEVSARMKRYWAARLRAN